MDPKSVLDNNKQPPQNSLQENQEQPITAVPNTSGQESTTSLDKPLADKPLADKPPEPTIPIKQPLPEESLKTASSKPKLDSNQPPTKPKSKKALFTLVAFILLLILFIGLSSLAYAVANEKIKLEKYPDFQKSVAHFVQGLPFMPKTPKFLLVKSVVAHQNVTRHSFDISTAIDSSNLASSLGLSNLDFEAKGAVDYNDPNNLIVNLNAFITRDFNFELRKKDPILYFKINKVPSSILAVLGLDQAQLEPILNKWVAYDTTPLDTEARKQIQKQEDEIDSDFLEEINEKYIDDKILDKMTVSQVKEDGTSLYRISLAADDELVDYIGRKIEEEPYETRGMMDKNISEGQMHKLSDIVKNLSWETYIEKGNYYTRKIVISAVLEFDEASYGTSFFETTPLSGSSSAKVAFVAKFGNFGESVVVEAPALYITSEEFIKEISEISK